MPGDEGLGRAVWKMLDANGISNAQRCETPLHWAHVASETTCDVEGLGNPVERCWTHTSRSNERGDGGQLEMMQDARYH